MPPADPLGRYGPTLDNFLLKEPTLPESLPPICPYQKKCTYGNKCKYYHPERGNKPQRLITEKLAEEAQLKMLQVKERQLSEQSDGKLYQYYLIERILCRDGACLAQGSQK
jgi:ribonuclease ZC3H12